MTTAIIVEDEPSLRVLIKKMVREIDPTIDIIGECENVDQGIKALQSYKPDIVFLDVVLPGGSGLDLLDKLPGLQSEVIFVTAYNKYVLDAFEHAAVGFVLKPIDKDKLKIAITNAKKRLGEKQESSISNLLDYMKSQNSKQKIGISTQDGIIFVNSSDILRCEGYNSYTKIYLVDRQCIISSYNLLKFVNLLPESVFFKVHKSHLISLDFVKSYNSRDSVVEMENGDSIPISKKVKKEFLNLFNTARR